MRRFLLDTNMAACFMNRRRGVYERCRSHSLKGDVVGICVPVLGELRFGVENSASRERNYLLLQRTIPAWRVWPYAVSTTEVFGRLAAHLSRVGRPMQSIDIMIASIALELGNCSVVSSDSDLLAVPELEVVNWADS
jgi:tRNA(fMet)-specific endonuclease VapC